MTLITLPRFESDSGLSWHRAGSGPPLLLIHGVGLRLESWYAQIEAFSPDYTVYTVDTPGHGFSAMAPIENPAVEDFADIFAAFVRDVIGEPVFLAGHSLGALISIEFGARHPDLCRAFVALTPVFERNDSDFERVSTLAESLREDAGYNMSAGPVERWFGGDQANGNEDNAAMCAQWLDANDRQGYLTAYAAFATIRGADRKRVAALAMPALFLTAEFDPNSTPDMSRALAELAPHGEVVIVPDCRHMLQMTHPDIVNAHMLEFFNTVG